MRVRSNEYLSEFITGQFDLVKYRRMISAYLEIIATFQAMLDDEYFKIQFNDNGNIRIGGSKKPNSNQMTSMLIKEYDTEEKMQEVLLQFKMAFNSLNDLEKDIFRLTFINQLRDIDICIELCIYQKKLIIIRNSAMIRFSLFLGLDKFVNLF